MREREIDLHPVDPEESDVNVAIAGLLQKMEILDALIFRAMEHDLEVITLLALSGRSYALLLDISGEDEVEGDAQVRLQLANPRRDATALTVVEVERAGTELPRYRAVDRRLWLGTKHTALREEILAIFSQWRASRLVLDATGVGAGLTSFLSRDLPGKVLPVVYTSAKKSRIGWEFLGAIETGRYKDYLPDGKSDTRQFWYEVDRCGYEVVPGPSHRLAVRAAGWRVPGGGAVGRRPDARSPGEDRRREVVGGATHLITTPAPLPLSARDCAKMLVLDCGPAHLAARRGLWSARSR